MSKHPADLLVFDPSSLRIGKELKRSEASSIFEVGLLGHRYAMKVFHDNGDPGFTRKGRDLNRFRCELNAYRNLHLFGACEQGVVPYYYGYIDHTEELNCVNYSDDRLQAAIVGLRRIHSALIHHRDIYPKNILIIRGHGHPDRVVWIDFDVAVTFDPGKSMGYQATEHCNLEIELVKSFGDLLKEDQSQGLPPNTKYY